jgi:hypothetical protein
MPEIEILKYALAQFANLDETDFAISEKYRQHKAYNKATFITGTKRFVNI